MDGMSPTMLPSFFEIVRRILALDPEIFTAVVATNAGGWVALVIVLLAGLAESLGQSVVLFLNRVRPLRFGLALLMSTVNHLIGYGAWTLTIWSVGGLLTGHSQPFATVAVVVGLAYAPQMLAFFELTPYLGNIFWGILTLWSMFAIVVALGAGLNLVTWQALLVSGLGWIVLQAVRRTVGRPFAHFERYVQRRVAGVPMTFGTRDVKRLRRHRAATWYMQLDSWRRRTQTKQPAQDETTGPREQQHV